MFCYARLFFGHLKKLKAKKTQANFWKKLKQIIQKLNNSPTKTNIFFKKSPEFNRFCTRFCSSFSFSSKLSLKSVKIREFWKKSSILSNKLKDFLEKLKEFSEKLKVSPTWVGDSCGKTSKKACMEWGMVGFPVIINRHRVLIEFCLSTLWHSPQVSKRGRLPDVFYKQKHPKYEQLKHCVVKTKTNHVAVLQTLSTTFQFLRAFWILVLVCWVPSARSGDAHEARFLVESW